MTSNVPPGGYYGAGVPYLPLNTYPGSIIAIEGTDGVGRSTQIALLREWLEVQGYGVVETGWARSALIGPTIDLAKASNTLVLPANVADVGAMIQLALTAIRRQPGTAGPS